MFRSLLIFLGHSARELTVTMSRMTYLDPPEEKHVSIAFYSVLVSIFVFIALSTVFHSINSPDNSPFSHSVLPVLFLPYWSFQLYISYETLLQPWYNLLWLTGLKNTPKPPINWLTKIHKQGIEWENGQLSGEFMEWNTVERTTKTENIHKNRIKKKRRVGKLGWFMSKKHKPQTFIKW